MNILIVDDDEDDRSIIVEILGELDKSIQHVSYEEGKDALDFLKGNHDALPDLIFLDLNMPMMDGKEFLKILKRDPVLMHIPVAIYTTSKLPQDVEETRILGASHFIVKPSNFQELKNEISDLLADLSASIAT